MIGWHLPIAFEFALRHETWHDVEHVCFFVTSIMFWWPVVQPRPSVARWPRWTVPLYLFLGMLANDGLSAFLTFCDRVLYPSYASARRFPISPLEDQALSGAIMWVFGAFVYLVPAVVVALQMLSSPESPRRSLGQASAGDERVRGFGVRLASGGEWERSPPRTFFVMRSGDRASASRAASSPLKIRRSLSLALSFTQAIGSLLSILSTAICAAKVVPRGRVTHSDEDEAVVVLESRRELDRELDVRPAGLGEVVSASR